MRGLVRISLTRPSSKGAHRISIIVEFSGLPSFPLTLYFVDLYVIDKKKRNTRYVAWPSIEDSNVYPKKYKKRKEATRVTSRVRRVALCVEAT